MKKQIILTILAAILTILFVYTASEKIFNTRDFHGAMDKQPLPEWLKAILLITLPILEYLVAILFISPKTWRIGFAASTVLMFAFTIYVGLGLAHAFKYVPCTCGGVFRDMSWQNHFILNLGLLAIAVTGLWITRKKVPSEKKESKKTTIQYS